MSPEIKPNHNQPDSLNQLRDDLANFQASESLTLDDFKSKESAFLTRLEKIKTTLQNSEQKQKLAELKKQVQQKFTAIKTKLESSHKRETLIQAQTTPDKPTKLQIEIKQLQQKLTSENDREAGMKNFLKGENPHEVDFENDEKIKKATTFILQRAENFAGEQFKNQFLLFGFSEKDLQQTKLIFRYFISRQLIETASNDKLFSTGIDAFFSKKTPINFKELIKINPQLKEIYPEIQNLNAFKKLFTELAQQLRQSGLKFEKNQTKNYLEKFGQALGREFVSEQTLNPGAILEYILFNSPGKITADIGDFVKLLKLKTELQTSQNQQSSAQLKNKIQARQKEKTAKIQKIKATEKNWQTRLSSLQNKLKQTTDQKEKTKIQQEITAFQHLQILLSQKKLRTEKTSGINLKQEVLADIKKGSLPNLPKFKVRNATEAKQFLVKQLTPKLTGRSPEYQTIYIQYILKRNAEIIKNLKPGMLCELKAGYLQIIPPQINLTKKADALNLESFGGEWGGILKFIFKIFPGLKDFFLSLVKDNPELQELIIDQVCQKNGVNTTAAISKTEQIIKNFSQYQAIWQKLHFANLQLKTGGNYSVVQFIKKCGNKKPAEYFSSLSDKKNPARAMLAYLNSKKDSQGNSLKLSLTLQDLIYFSETGTKDRPLLENIQSAQVLRQVLNARQAGIEIHNQSFEYIDPIEKEFQTKSPTELLQLALDSQKFIGKELSSLELQTAWKNYHQLTSAHNAFELAQSLKTSLGQELQTVALKILTNKLITDDFCQFDLQLYQKISKSALNVQFQKNLKNRFSLLFGIPEANNIFIRNKLLTVEYQLKNQTGQLKINLDPKAKDRFIIEIAGNQIKAQKSAELFR